MSSAPTFHTALARIFSDLIKADTVIDVDELEKYASYCDSHSISKEDEKWACHVSLEEAVTKLSSYPQSKKEHILKDCINLSLSDGFCAYSEALLILAYQMCLNSENSLTSEVISIPTPNVCIENQQVLYVESTCDTIVNEQIQQSYRNISNELRLTGFKLVYIPKIASHYRHYNEKTFTNIVRFLSPQLLDSEIESLVDKLLHITTSSFCNEQLCNHLGINQLKDSAPSFLIKISENYVNFQQYTNFLRVSVDGNVLSTVKTVVDNFRKMLSSDAITIPNIEDVGEQFLYQGFYKQLFDMYTLKQGVESRLLIDFENSELLLPDANLSIKGLRRKEKAFYILLLYKSKSGGINFNAPQSAEQLEKYKQYLTDIQAEYSRIYVLLGGEQDVTPDIGNPDIRRPLISVIRNKISAFNSILYNIDNYNISKDADGNFSVKLNPELIQVQTSDGIISLHSFLC